MWNCHQMFRFHAIKKYFMSWSWLQCGVTTQSTNQRNFVSHFKIPILLFKRGLYLNTGLIRRTVSQTELLSCVFIKDCFKRFECRNSPNILFKNHSTLLYTSQSICWHLPKLFIGLFSDIMKSGMFAKYLVIFSS